MKKAIVLTIIILTAIPTFAKEIPIKVKPLYKITTSNKALKEGDSLDFFTTEDVYVNTRLIVKKGQKLQGIATNIIDNGFLIKPASIYIENFKARDENGKLVKFNGTIYSVGNYHKVFGEVFVCNIIRGGEVQIKPEKDEYTLYFEDNK